MPVVLILSDLPRHHASALDTKITKALLEMPKLLLKDDSDVSVMLSPAYSVGRPCIINILLDMAPQRTKKVLDEVAEKVGDILQKHANFTFLEVFTGSFDKNKSGYWICKNGK